MAEYWQISSPGQRPLMRVGFDLPDGDSLDESSIVITGSIDGITAADIEVSDAAMVIEGVEYPAGSVVTFTLIAAAGIELFSNQDPYFVYMDAVTLGAPTVQSLLWEKRLDVYPRLPMD